MGKACAVSNIRFMAYFSAAAMALIAIYFPAFVHDFGIHNDYLTWSYNNRKCCLGFPESYHLLYVGRPIGALLLNVHLAAFTNIPDLKYGRLFGFFTLITAYWLYCILLTRRYKLNAELSLISGLLIFTLPSAILYVTWITNYIPGIFNVLLVTVAYALVSSPTTQCYKYGFYLPLIGYVLFFVSFWIYPPTSLFFFIFPFAAALFIDKNKWVVLRRRIIWTTTIGIVLFILYYMLVKFVSVPVLEILVSAIRNYTPPSSYEISLTTENLTEKLFLFKKLMITIFNIGFANYINFWVVFLGIALLVSLLLARQLKGKKYYDLLVKSRILERFAVVALLFILAISPVLAPSNGFIAFRIIFVASAMAVLLLCWMVHLLYKDSHIGIKMASVAVLTVITVASLAYGWFRHDLLVSSATREYNFIRSNLQRIDLVREKTVKVILPNWGDHIAAYPMYYDFSYLNTNFAFADGMLLNIIKQLGFDYRSYRIETLKPAVKQLVNPEWIKYCSNCIDMEALGYLGKVPQWTSDMGPMQPSKGDDKIDSAMKLIDDINGVSIWWLHGKFYALAVSPGMSANVFKTEYVTCSYGAIVRAVGCVNKRM